MKTEKIVVHYTLTNEGYEKLVASATGPVNPKRECEIPVGDLTSEGRLVLLHHTEYGEIRADQIAPRVKWPVYRDDAPTAEEVSTFLVSERALRVLERFVRDIDGLTRRVRERAKDEQDRQRREAEQAAKAAAEAAVTAKRLAWVVAHPDRFPEHIVRAAKEGRQIKTALEKLQEERVCEALDAVAHDVGCYGTAQTYGDQSYDGLPEPRTYALIDALTAARSTIAPCAFGSGVEVTIGDLVRTDVAPRGSAVYRFAVPVTVRSIEFGEHEWNVLVDSPEQEQEDE